MQCGRKAGLNIRKRGDGMNTEANLSDNNLFIILFYSRNKDNKGLKNYKQRRMSFVSRTGVTENIYEQFQLFVKKGVNGEMSRLYVSLNAYDSSRVQKQLQHYLLDNIVDLEKLDAVIASLAAKTQPLTKKCLLDYDGNMDDFYLFDNDVRLLVGDNYLESYNTVSGAGIVVKKSFDTRELLTKYPNVEFKRTGAMFLYDYKIKEEVPE